MKPARFILKIVGASLAFAGLVCLTVGYWETLGGLVRRAGRVCRRSKPSGDFENTDW